MDSPQWITAARGGDLQAFNRLVLAHQDAVYNLAYRLLGSEQAAVEAAQAAFRTAFHNLGVYRGCSLRDCLYRSLLAVCSLSGLAASRARCDPAKLDALQSGLDALPPELRRVLALVDIAGLEYAEAALLLGLSPEQVGGRLAAARRLWTKTAVTPA